MRKVLALVFSMMVFVGVGCGDTAGSGGTAGTGNTPGSGGTRGGAGGTSGSGATDGSGATGGSVGSEWVAGPCTWQVRLDTPTRSDTWDGECGRGLEAMVIYSGRGMASATSLPFTLAIITYWEFPGRGPITFTEEDAAYRPGDDSSGIPRVPSFAVEFWAVVPHNDSTYKCANFDGLFDGIDFVRTDTPFTVEVTDVREGLYNGPVGEFDAHGSIRAVCAGTTPETLGTVTVRVDF